MAYGNPNVPNAGFECCFLGCSKCWADSGGLGSVPAGQSPGGAAGYGNQGYGYGSYGGNDGSHGNPAGYGVVGRSGGTPNSNVGGPGGAELQGSGGGYMGGGYDDANGNSVYGNAAWRSEQSQASGNYGAPQANGHHGGYCDGYASSQARQAQQQ
ncbi:HETEROGENEOUS NUCLEAR RIBONUCLEOPROTEIN 1 [Salix koriyanagi]|uniref:HETEROGENEOUS NUCLEAR RIBONUCLEOPROTEIN 1 n=1 Tax=Salix koriyanagi TaxID=2511006 RepID=A0A9Q0WQP9_9ROSI|nr:HETEROGENEOUS NUCLEAR RIBONUCLEOPROTEIN 1 [Salix koriyanagi]